MEALSDQSDPVLLSDSNIRMVQADLEAQLKMFHKKIPNANFMDTYNVCENIRDKVLNQEDEPHLSKSQNNCRRICIASDLFVSICSVYECVVENEFTKIIRSLLQWNKYKFISQKITKGLNLETKKEKYFISEAQSKLQKSLQVAEAETSRRPRPVSSSCPRTEELEASAEYEESTTNKELELIQAVDEEIHASELTGILDPVMEHLALDELSDGNQNFTEIRAESLIDTTALQCPALGISREVNSFPSAVSEIPLKDANIQQNTEGDINDILQILETQNIEKPAEVVQPETLLETSSAVREAPVDIVIEKSPSFEDELVEQMEQLESLEEWNLPDLEPVAKRRREARHLIIDETITIPNYAERALNLNSNIEIHRVQVFEGPPKILRAMSVSHSMRTPAFKNSLFFDVRSGNLSRLFERHLRVEKKPVESIIAPKMRGVEEHAGINVSKVRADKAALEIVEDVGMRAGMHAMAGRTDALVEMTKNLEDLEIPTGGRPMESLLGMPMSRIISSTIEPPDMERINAVPVTSTPRAQQLQGKTLDPDRHSSWFYSTKKNAPSAKYREFNYVHKKLQEYWSLFEIQGMEKSISLQEFFQFEVNSSSADFLTVLRIVDKLSLQRKLVLEYKNHDVLIRPFENPFVTEKQLLLKAKEPIL